MSIVELHHVVKEYPLGATSVKALRGISLAIEAGDFISIAGPSGSGKTTALNMIGCIDTPTAGTVKINGISTEDLNDRNLTDLRHKTIGFIFQSFNLIPVLNVYENIEFPLLLGDHPLQKPDRGSWIEALMDSVGLGEQRTQKPNELSGGQRQRVAIARALVGKPKIVLADEPTANLDSKTGEAIIELMKSMNREYGTTFIFSTHDPVIMDLADHSVLLQDGEIIKDAKKSNEKD